MFKVIYFLLCPVTFCHLPFYINFLWKSNDLLNGKWQDNYDKLRIKLFEAPWGRKFKLANQMLLTKNIDEDFAFYFERWIIRHLLIDSNHPNNNLDDLNSGHSSTTIEQEMLVGLFIKHKSRLVREIKRLIARYDDPLAILNLNMLFSQELTDAMAIILGYSGLGQRESEAIIYKFNDFLDFSDCIFVRARHFLMLENVHGNNRKDSIASEVFTLHKSSGKFMDLLYLRHLTYYFEQLLKRYYLDFRYIDLLIFYTQRALVSCPKILNIVLDKLLEQVKTIKERWLRDYCVDGENVGTFNLIRFYLSNSTFFGLSIHFIQKHMDPNSPLLIGDQIILRAWDMKFKLYQIYSTVKNEFYRDEAKGGNNQHFNALMRLYEIFSKAGLSGQPFEFYESINNEIDKVLEMWNIGLKERFRMIFIQGDNSDSIILSRSYSDWKAFLLRNIDANVDKALYQALKENF